MKNNIFSVLIFSLFAMAITSCSNSGQSEKDKLSFKESSYQIHSGERITVEQNYSGVIYSFAGAIPLETAINEKTGEITFSENTPNYSQVILVATYKEIKSDQAVVTLLQNEITTELSFHNPIDNIIDGDYILVSSLNNTAITYSLKEEVTGVSINSMSGRVSYNSAAVEGSTFTVVATSANASIEHTFNVTVSKLVTSLTPLQTLEIGANTPATYVLDFSKTPIGTEESVIGIMNDRQSANENEYTYNQSLHTLVINPSFLNTFKTGENTLKIITPRNVISVDFIVVTKFIRNAADLQSINKNRESLGGYYILENDIDLTDYLSKGGEGYNDYRGWNQIGIYHDLENDSTRDSFTGTFDGNGHIISGFFEDRADDLAHNEGLFGYVTNQAVIKNVGFVGASKKTNGRNFIGGFVGFNEGTIKNCWVDVNISNKHEDKIFHSVGAFAGANTGIIDSCYTLGKPEGDTFVGTFVGKNYGDITNCYSLNETNTDFCGTQVTGSHENCQIFTTLSAMKNFDFASHFDNSAWDFPANELPILKHLVNVEYVNGLEITNKESELFVGDVLEVNIVIHPNDLMDSYLDNVNYAITPETGSGISQNNNKFNLANAQVEEFIVYATLELPHGTFTASKQFKIYQQISSVDFVDDLPTYVEPGKQYRMNVNIQPSSAPQDMTWEILSGIDSSGRTTKPGRFAFFTNNILTIKEEMMNFSSKEEHPKFSVKGTAKNGMSVTKELTLKRIHYLSDTYSTSQEGDDITQNVIVVYKDSIDEYITFTLPSTAEVSSMKVYRFNSLITDYSRTGHKIKIPVRYIKDIPNIQITFSFRCGTGDSEIVYRGYGCYISHDRYTINDVQTSYIALSSADDFYQYFRLKLDDNHKEKWNNYDKTFVLTNDIDFNNATGLVAIGYYSTSYQDGIHPFSGKIYGFGHKIKNARFEYSERYYVVGPSDPNKKADPNTYRVGFFGYFQGEIYDVIFENIHATSYNYGGCFAGSIRSGGYLENVTFVDCKTYSANEVDYTIDDVVQGRITALNAGTFVAVTYNGTAVGLVG